MRIGLLTFRIDCFMYVQSKEPIRCRCRNFKSLSISEMHSAGMHGPPADDRQYSRRACRFKKNLNTMISFDLFINDHNFVI